MRTKRAVIFGGTRMTSAERSRGTEDASPDSEDRIQDFFARHGGAGTAPSRRDRDASGMGGWSEVYAADGYVLRCDWSRMGSREEMKFSEIPPGAGERSR